MCWTFKYFSKQRKIFPTTFNYFLSFDKMNSIKNQLGDVINCPVTAASAIDFGFTFINNIPSFKDIINESLFQTVLVVDSILVFNFFLPVFIISITVFIILAFAGIISWAGLFFLIVISFALFVGFSILYRESVRSYISNRSNNLQDSLLTVWNSSLPNALNLAGQAYLDANGNASITCPVVNSNMNSGGLNNMNSGGLNGMNSGGLNGMNSNNLNGMNSGDMNSNNINPNEQQAITGKSVVNSGSHLYINANRRINQV